MNSTTILPLLITLAALVVSTLTFYFNFFRKADLELFPGELMLTYEPNYSLRLHSNFTLFNSGALPGALIYLEGTISSASGDNEAGFRWLNFTQSLSISEPGEEVKPWLTFSGWVEPVTIPGRSATVKGILLYTTE